MRIRIRRFMIPAALSFLASGCAATKSWWFAETGRMTEPEAAAHGHPECAGLTLRACERKQKEAARTAVPEGSHPGG